MKTSKSNKEKMLTFLVLSRRVSAYVGWIENPCVGGSIPPQATSHLKSLLFI